MTRDEWLARCATAYDMGLITPERLLLLDRWADAVLREGHSRVCNIAARQEAHWRCVERFWEGETARLVERSRLDGDGYMHTLANDTDGYALVELAAVFSHPCPICATDPKAWHTRVAFCQHRKDGGKP